MGRDVYSLLHFAMALGVIAFAVAVEKAILHPEEALSFAGRLALALGVALFTGGMGLALWRATKKLRRLRMIIAIATATIIVSVSGLPPAFNLAIAFVGLVAIALVEHRSDVPASTINL
jgi:hypothetical protein